VGCHDIQVVLADDSAQEFGVFLHHKGRKVELALGHELGLFQQSVVRQVDIQPPKVFVREELSHEVGRAGAFRTDPDGCSAQIGKGVKGVGGFTEE
jgi:hypothetical protein